MVAVTHTFLWRVIMILAWATGVGIQLPYSQLCAQTLRPWHSLSQSRCSASFPQLRKHSRIVEQKVHWFVKGYPACGAPRVG